MSDDLFPAFDMDTREREGWMRRALRELEHVPALYCYPGFMGAVHERLTARGLASKETIGPAPMPPGWDMTAKEWADRAGTLHRYTITPAGLAELARRRADEVGDVL